VDSGRVQKMKTVTYLKAGLVSREAIETKPEASLNQSTRVKEEKKMDLFTKAFLKVRERFVRFHRAQTMTEYALILAAIAVVVYGTYRALGNNIGSLANGVDSALTNA
jgi:Flp pilus assembly pilin Flp